MSSSVVNEDGELGEAETSQVPRTPGVPKKSPSATAHFLADYSLVFVMLGLIVLFTILAGSTFFSAENFEVMLSSQAALVILALAAIVPLVTDEFDVSVGAMLSFTAVEVWALTNKVHMGVGLAVVLTLLTAAALGGVNALLIVRLRIHSFIATLAMGTLLSGLALKFSDGSIVTNVPKVLTTIAGSKIIGIQLIFFIAIGIAVVLWYLAEHTPLGRWTLSVGAGSEISRLVGLPVTRIRVGALVVSATIAGVGGILYAGQFGAADPTSGPGQLLPAFAAVFLGSTAVRRGRFNVWGTVLAVYLVIIGIVGLQITTGASGWVVDVFNGGILIVALAFSNVIGSRPTVH